MRVHVVHPGVNWSLSDVYDGVCYGLRANGVELVPMLDADRIIVVNGNLHEPETIRQWRSICPVFVLCTESPYDFDQEVERIRAADGGWTHERLSVAPLSAANQHVSYLPHAWHPERHRPSEPDPRVRAHDVVFVGTGFSERVEWFNRIDWTGIDLGLYGLWDGMGLSDDLERHVVQYVTPNDQTIALYRRAKMGLNLYRRKGGLKGGPRLEMRAESLNPRAYELAACGVFHLSTAREEVFETFGDMVPLISGTREMAKADEAIIRDWLNSPGVRASVSARLPNCVAGDSWVVRALQILQDIHAWSTVTA